MVEDYKSNPSYIEAPRYTTVFKGEPFVFLAGGITAVWDWQGYAAPKLFELGKSLPAGGLVVANPRRESFPIHDPEAAPAQIAWEYRHLRVVNGVTMFWFPECDPAKTVQPIALLELGAALGEGRRIVVGVDPGYPRALDVRVQCGLARPGLVVHGSLDAVIAGVIAEFR